MLGQQTLLSQGIGFFTGRRQQRVQPQALVIIDVFIAQGRCVDALTQQLFDGMFHPKRVATIAKALGQGPSQAQSEVHLAQQERAGIAGESAAAKVCLHPASSQVIKEQ